MTKCTSSLLVLAILIVNSALQIQSSATDDGDDKDEHYDFVVVGGSTTGCVVASRLAENPRWKVLVLEAGSFETFNMGIPLNVLQLQQSPAISWKHQTQASSKKHNYCLAMKEGRCNWPMGKVMGGSSVLDDMIHSRGNHKDFDDWHEAGNKGWSFRDVLPHFKKAENNELHDADRKFIGKTGPITISYPKWRSPLAAAFIKAGLEIGMAKVDYNGAEQIGFSYVQTTTKRGIRQSTQKAYIAATVRDTKSEMYHMKGRNNLHMRQFITSPRLLMDKYHKKVWGVQYQSLGHTHVVFAKHEVILADNVVGTTEILLRAGIGPLDHLREAKIEPIKVAPVGLNLVDPVAVGGLTFFTNTTVLDLENLLTVERLHAFEYTHEAQLSSPGGVEALAFFDTEHHDGVADIQVRLEAKSILSHPVLKINNNIDPHLYDVMYRSVEHLKSNAFTLTPIVLQPKSRGWITLSDSKPHSVPKIYPNYLNHPLDIRAAIRGIRICLALVKTRAFRAVGAKLHYVPIPNCEHHKHNSDAYWECYVRHFTYTTNRPSGTTRMGQDPAKSVVDAQLKVHGIGGVRIVNAGIMPKPPAGFSTSTLVMIAEKAADMIKQEHSTKYEVHEHEHAVNDEVYGKKKSKKRQLVRVTSVLS